MNGNLFYFLFLFYISLRVIIDNFTFFLSVLNIELCQLEYLLHTYILTRDLDSVTNYIRKERGGLETVPESSKNGSFIFSSK